MVPVRSKNGKLTPLGRSGGAERVHPVSGRRRGIATITPERRLGSLSDDLGVDFAAVLAEKGKNVDPGFQAKLKAIFDAGEESVRVWRKDVGLASAKNLALRRRLPVGVDWDFWDGSGGSGGSCA